MYTINKNKNLIQRLVGHTIRHVPWVLCIYIFLILFIEKVNDGVQTLDRIVTRCVIDHTTYKHGRRAAPEEGICHKAWIYTFSLINL